MENNVYTVKQVRDNVTVHPTHPTAGTFDVLAEYNSDVRWISVPYDLFFKWALSNSKTLELYIEKHKLKTWEDIIKDLNELEYDWNANMVKYMDKYYAKRLFKLLPQYNADNLGDKFMNDFDEDDDE